MLAAISSNRSITVFVENRSNLLRVANIFSSGHLRFERKTRTQIKRLL